MTLSNKFFSFYCNLKGKYEKFISFEDRKGLFNIYLSNPFRMWWKAHKYFKMPKPYFQFFYKKKTVSIPAPYCWEGAISKILDIKISDLCWKDKFNSPRYEYAPCIFICFFKKFGINITPHIYGINEFGEKENRDMEYWEYLLEYVAYKRGLKLSSFWITESKIAQQRKYGNKEDGSEDEVTPYRLPIFTHLFSLNKRGLKIFKRLYDKGTNTRNNSSSSEESGIL